MNNDQIIVVTIKSAIFWNFLVNSKYSSQTGEKIRKIIVRLKYIIPIT